MIPRTFLFAALAATCTAAASTIATAGFETNTPATGLATLAATGGDNLAWSEISGVPAAGSISIVSPGLNSSTNALSGVGSAVSYGDFGTFANATTLATGDSLTLQFDLSLANVGNNTQGFRFGFSTGNATTGKASVGVHASTGTAAATLQFGVNNTGNGTGFSQTLGTATGTGFASLANATTYTGNTLTLTKTVSGYDLATTIAGATYTGATTASGSFDNLTGIYFLNGSSGATQTFTIDNVAVSYTAVPEPSTYGLLGAGALAAGALVRRRRRAA